MCSSLPPPSLLTLCQRKNWTQTAGYLENNRNENTVELGYPYPKIILGEKLIDQYHFLRG